MNIRFKVHILWAGNIIVLNDYLNIVKETFSLIFVIDTIHGWAST